jgi:hypothetical protein
MYERARHSVSETWNILLFKFFVNETIRGTKRSVESAFIFLYDARLYVVSPVPLIG